MQSIIIVGGGIIGLLTAYELHKAGQRVTLIDRQSFGQESSWAGGGIISPLYPWRYPDPVTRLAALSQQLYPELLANMQRRTGIDPEFLNNGMLILGEYKDEAPQDWASNHAVDMQKVSGDRIHRLAPEIRHQLDSGWWLPGIHQLRNPRLVALARAYLKTTDITLIENQPVTDILIRDDRVTAIRTNSTTHTADSVVIAGGAWSSQLLLPTGLDIGIKPVKGQMLLLKGPPGTVKRITLSEDRYIIPRQDGHVLIGSTTEDVGFNKQTTASVRQQLLDYALRTIPALESFNLAQHWSGLRPGSIDGIPRIGRHPSLSNLYINSGHYRNGLVMAPASARLLSEIILQKATCLAENDYIPCDTRHARD